MASIQKNDAQLNSSTHSFMRFVYLLLSVALLAGLVVWPLYLPLALVGFFVPFFRLRAERLLRFAVRVLMRIQPGFRIDSDLPDIRALSSRLGHSVLTVSNHRSHLDTFLLLTAVPGIRLLAKRDLFFVPLLGLMMWITRQIPVKRGNLGAFWKAMQRIRKGLRAGDPVHVFPEMTRCAPGFNGVNAFNAAPFACARHENAWILPLVITGTDAVWPKGALGLNPKHRMRVRALEPMDPSKFPDAQSAAEYCRELIADALSGPEGVLAS